MKTKHTAINASLERAVR